MSLYRRPSGTYNQKEIAKFVGPTKTRRQIASRVRKEDTVHFGLFKDYVSIYGKDSPQIRKTFPRLTEQHKQRLLARILKDQRIDALFEDGAKEDGEEVDGDADNVAGEEEAEQEEEKEEEEEAVGDVDNGGGQEGEDEGEEDEGKGDEGEDKGEVAEMEQEQEEEESEEEDKSEQEQTEAILAEPRKRKMEIAERYDAVKLEEESSSDRTAKKQKVIEKKREEDSKLDGLLSCLQQFKKEIHNYDLKAAETLRLCTCIEEAVGIVDTLPRLSPAEPTFDPCFDPL